MNMKSIEENREKSNRARLSSILGGYGAYRRQILGTMIVVLVAIASFGLGRLSIVLDTRQPVRIIPPVSQTASVGTIPVSKPDSVSVTTHKPYVASKTGKAYYLRSCAAADRIKEENKVWFSTTQEAEKAGYTKAANCPGL